MIKFLRSVLDDGGTAVRGKIAAVYLILIAANIAAWAWTFMAFAERPVLLGTALLAYSLGLRHAVDADHIAAIDNVTRKLMQEGKRPVLVGFFFSLGHASVVVVASILVAGAAFVLKDQFQAFRDVGGMIGTSISALFLIAIAVANLLIFLSLYRSFRGVRRGGRLIEEDLDALLTRRGLLGRILRPLFRFIARSWHMYPLGILFGLGFETASEISLFSLSVAEASRGLSIAAILVFPALFAAGMTLIDTTDGVLMLGAYGWAFVKPIRKLYYNLTVTFVSVLVALLIGSVEALGLLADKLSLSGAFWDGVAAVNEHFGTLGYAIIGLFVASWLASMAVYKVRGFDRLEVRG
jgi:high-affinity nickel-transport protein